MSRFTKESLEQAGDTFRRLNPELFGGTGGKRTGEIRASSTHGDVLKHPPVPAEYRIFLPGIPPSKKNNKRIAVNNATGKRFIISSKEYLEWEKEMRLHIVSQWSQGPIDYPVEVRMIFFVAGNRAWDLSNKIESISDALVKYGVLQDDNRFIIKKLLAEWGKVPDNSQEGVQIVIQ